LKLYQAKKNFPIHEQKMKCL